VRSQAEEIPGRPVKAVTAIKNVSLLTVTGAGVLGVPEVIASVFTAIARENITLLMVSQSSSMSNVSLAVPSADAARALQALRAGLSSELNVEETNGVAVLAIVGSGMRGQQGVSARLFTALASEDINILMISQGSSELNISVALSGEEVDRATAAVHAAFTLSQPVGA